MAIKLDKEKFKQIDSAFVDILDGKTGSLSTIGTVLSDVFDKKFKVEIMKPKPNTPFHIMSIFPEQSTITKLVDSIVNEKSDKELKTIWDENTNWTIEIDNRILTGSFINASSKELTALILHECGHVIYSNSIPQRMSKIMKYQYAKANVATKKILKNGVFKKILELPILKACMFENYKSDAGLKRELKADVFAVKMGYGDELREVLTKIIAKSSPNKQTGSHIDEESGKTYDRMHSDTMFSINLVEDLKKREANLTRTKFSKMLLDIPSEFVLKIVKPLETSMFNKKMLSFQKDDLAEESFTVSDYIFESITLLENSTYFKEGFSGFMKKKMERIDPGIVDYIYVRKSGMKTNDDKLMLVSYISDKLGMVDYYLTLLEDPRFSDKYIPGNTLNELRNMKKNLEKLKISILEYKIPEIHYGIQVVYPDGYEG